MAQHCGWCGTPVDETDCYCGGCGREHSALPGGRRPALSAVLRLGTLALAAAAVLIPLALYIASQIDSDRAFHPSPPLLVVVIAGSLVLAAKAVSLGRRAAALMASNGLLLLLAMGLGFVAVPAASAYVTLTAPPLPAAFTHQAEQTVKAFVQPSAWSAAFNIAPKQGPQAFAPLFYQPAPVAPPQVFVPGQPAVLYAVPAAAPPYYQPVAVANSTGVLPFTPSYQAAWQKIPPAAVTVPLVVLMPNARAPSVPAAALNPAVLQANCGTCWNQLSLAVNPDYVDKLVLDGAKVLAVSIPVPYTGGIINVSDLISATESFQNGMGVWHETNNPAAAVQAVSADFGNWVVNQGLAKTGAGIFGEDVARAVAPSLQIAALEVKPFQGPRAATVPQWSWQVTKMSGGSLDLGGSAMRWASVTTDTYRGTFLEQGWNSVTTTRVTEGLDVPAYNPPAYNPPAYNPPAYNPPAHNPPAYNPPVYNPPAFRP